MRQLIKNRLKGLKSSLGDFYKKTSCFRRLGPLEAAKTIASCMDELGLEGVSIDKTDNVVGFVDGYDNKGDLILISTLNFDSRRSNANVDKPLHREVLPSEAGVISSIYTAALVKKAFLPLEGKLFVCSVPRIDCCDVGIKHIFQEYFKGKTSNIKGIILCEPTGFNVYLGHRGHMEYEISVKRRFPEASSSADALALIEELKKVSRTLPHNYALGDSSLRVKNFNHALEGDFLSQKEFKVTVDRFFVPEEKLSDILHRAKSIAENIYDKGKVTASVAEAKINTADGLRIISRKEFSPWKMERNHPFVVSCLEVLGENKFDASLGYWKETLTQGSYTFGKLKIPTVGFGPGSEDQKDTPVSLGQIGKAIYANTLMVMRNVGMPAFGWSRDEI